MSEPQEVTATDPEVMEVFDRFNGMASKETAIEIVRKRRNPTREWLDVQRGAPAEFVIGVPDEATVWYCLVHHTHTASITVYWVADTDEAYVTASGDDFATPVEHFEDVDHAVVYAQDVRDELEINP